MADHHPHEIQPPDITPLRFSNTGVDYVHVLDSGRAGPTVMVQALTHGNEFCGALALEYLFRERVTPARGTLVLAFANVAAYARFDRDDPDASRFVDEDYNRVWDDAVGFGPRDTVELRRARQLRPFVEAAAAADPRDRGRGRRIDGLSLRGARGDRAGGHADRLRRRPSLDRALRRHRARDAFAEAPEARHDDGAARPLRVSAPRCGRAVCDRAWRDGGAPCRRAWAGLPARGTRRSQAAHRMTGPMLRLLRPHRARLRPHPSKV
jgi:hypothetical protein